MQERLIERAKALLKEGRVNRVLGWKKGEFDYDETPGVFSSADELDKAFVFDDFSAPNLSKYLVKLGAQDGVTLVFLKPCDTYSFNQLIKEHRIKRESVYIVGIPCSGMIGLPLLNAKAGDSIISVSSDGKTVKGKTLDGDFSFSKESVLAERCRNCKSKKHVVYDELIGEEGEVLDSHRFDMVEKIEKMSPDERYAFWRGELSRCIRCNACKNVCPACTCENCIFDNERSGVSQKAAADSFEENMYHIIRAFHVAGRCTDCGECSRVCPQNIPLHLLNRKFIKDINELYGEYQAGADLETAFPLVSYTKGDAEPSIVMTRGEENA
jgi:Uncharacterized conserved protein containing a ferredoxin-like domain